MLHRLFTHTSMLMHPSWSVIISYCSLWSSILMIYSRWDCQLQEVTYWALLWAFLEWLVGITSMFLLLPLVIMLPWKLGSFTPPFMFLLVLHILLDMTR